MDILHKQIFDQLIGFGEKRMVFKKGGPEKKAAPAKTEKKDDKKEAGKDKKEEAKEGEKKGAETAKKTPEEIIAELQSSIDGKFSSIESVLDSVVANGSDLHTEGFLRFVHETKLKSIPSLKAKLKSILEGENKQNAIAEFKNTLTNELQSLGANFNQEVINQNAFDKEQIVQAKLQINEEKDQYSDKQAFYARVVEQIGTAEGIDPAAMLKGLEGTQSQDNLIKHVNAGSEQLKTAEQGTPSQTDEALNQYSGVTRTEIKAIQKDLEEFIQSRQRIVEKVSSIKEFIKGKEGEEAKKIHEALITETNQLLENPTSDADDVQELIDKHEQPLVIAKVVDALTSINVEVTPEELKEAMSYYALGQFEPGSENAEKHTAIIEGIAKLRESGGLDGLEINFAGYTDATKHGLNRSPEWFETRAKAFQGILDHLELGTLKPDTLADHIRANKDKIEGYIKATDRKKYIKDNNLNSLFQVSKGTDNGGLLDAALAYKRAENMKKRIDGDDATLSAKMDLELVLNTENVRSQKDRKSGFKFSIAEGYQAAIEDDPERMQYIDPNDVMKDPLFGEPYYGDSEGPEVPLTPEEFERGAIKQIDENIPGKLEEVPEQKDILDDPERMQYVDPKDPMTDPLFGEPYYGDSEGPEVPLTPEEFEKGAVKKLDEMVPGKLEPEESANQQLEDLAKEATIGATQGAAPVDAGTTETVHLDADDIGPTPEDVEESEGVYGDDPDAGGIDADATTGDDIEPIDDGPEPEETDGEEGEEDGSEEEEPEPKSKKTGSRGSRAAGGTAPSKAPVAPKKQAEEADPEAVLKEKGFAKSARSGFYKDVYERAGYDGFYTKTDEGLLYKDQLGQKILKDITKIDEPDAWEPLDKKPASNLPENLQGKGFYQGADGNLYRDGQDGIYKLNRDGSVYYQDKTALKLLGEGKDPSDPKNWMDQRMINFNR